MVSVRRTFAHGARSFFLPLAGAVVLLMITFPVVAADVALPLPNVEITPAKGKTGSFDIMEVDQTAPSPIRSRPDDCRRGCL